MNHAGRHPCALFPPSETSSLHLPGLGADHHSGDDSPDPLADHPGDAPHYPCDPPAGHPGDPRLDPHLVYLRLCLCLDLCLCPGPDRHDDPSLWFLYLLCAPSRPGPRLDQDREN